jgi:hypothetical protein
MSFIITQATDFASGLSQKQMPGAIATKTKQSYVGVSYFDF